VVIYFTTLNVFLSSLVQRYRRPIYVHVKYIYFLPLRLYSSASMVKMGDFCPHTREKGARCSNGVQRCRSVLLVLVLVVVVGVIVIYPTVKHTPSVSDAYKPFKKILYQFYENSLCSQAFIFSFRLFFVKENSPCRPTVK